MLPFNPSEQELVIVGLVRNLSSTIVSEVMRLDRVFGSFESRRWLVVESDSSDETLNELIKLQSTLDNFEYISEGVLEEKIPDRLARLSFCRNTYMKAISYEKKYGNTYWVAVIDLDSATPLLTAQKIESALASGVADAYSANLTGPYYDIVALRADGWVDDDPFSQYRQLIAEGESEKGAYKRAVRSKMLKIKDTAPPFEVRSAFGGFTIYKYEFFRGCRYGVIGAKDVNECEHVQANRDFRANGGKLVIFPSLTVAKYNQHTRYLHPVRRAFQPIISCIRQLVALTIGESKAHSLGSWLHAKTGL
jgi:hypothetical protein